MKRKKSRQRNAGCWVLGSGFWVLGSGFWVLDAGCWMLDAGFWMLGSGFWMLDAGCPIETIEKMETFSEKKTANNILPVFDPRPSAKFAADLLEATEQKGILIGRLAVWNFLKDTADHAYTKDLDIAVSEQTCFEIRRYLQDKDVAIRNLLIGGINVKSRADSDINVDFIDRSSQEWGDYGSLFREAIAEAFISNRTLRLDDNKILYVVSLEYLILMKLLTMEKKDEEDAKLLLWSAEPDISRIRDIISNHEYPAVRTRLEIIRTRLEIILRDMNHKESRLLRYKEGVS